MRPKKKIKRGNRSRTQQRSRFGYKKEEKQLAGRTKGQISCSTALREDTIVGVISCRSKEASLPPNYTWRELRQRRMFQQGNAMLVAPGWEKASGFYGERERDDNSTEKRMRLQISYSRPSRSPSVERETRQRHQFFLQCAFLAGQTFLCDEVPRRLPANQCGYFTPG